MINYNLKIDVSKEKLLSSDMVFITGDVGAYQLSFDFFDENGAVDISKHLLIIRVKRADGKCITASGTIKDNKGIFIPQNNIYAVPGELTIEIALTDGAKNHITTKIITAEVIEGIGDECIAEENEVSVFVTLFAQVQEKIEEVKALAKEIVPKKGTDYWTDEDIGEIHSYVDSVFNQNIVEALEGDY